MLPEETVKEAKAEINRVINKLMKKDKTIRVKVKVRTETNATVSNTNGEPFTAFRTSIKKIKGTNAKIALLSGATDLRFLMAKKIPCLGYSAREGAKWHSDNEFVYIKSLVETSQVLSLTIVNLQ